MKDDLWIAKLKVGDKVIVAGNDAYGLRPERTIERVSKVTPTTIVLERTRYRRDNGRQKTADAWHVARLEEPTPQRLKEVTNEIHYFNLRHRLEKFPWKSANLTTLEKVWAIIEADKTASNNE